MPAALDDCTSTASGSGSFLEYSSEVGHRRVRGLLAEAVVGKQAEDRLVTEAGGKTPTRQRLYRAFIALQKRLKIAPTWSFHSLRHAFGTHAIDRGANIEAVRELMGHADLTSTSRYVHASARTKRDVVALLGKEVEQAPERQPRATRASVHVVASSPHEHAAHAGKVVVVLLDRAYANAWSSRRSRK